MSGDTYNHHHLVLQVLDKKRFGNNNTRYRLLLSDGAMMTSFVTVGASLNDMSGELTEYTIIQVNSFNIIALNRYNIFLLFVPLFAFLYLFNFISLQWSGAQY